MLNKNDLFRKFPNRCVLPLSLLLPIILATSFQQLGAKKLYGRFCSGTIDHISIRQLQLILLKIALILGVEVHVKTEFVSIVPPPSKPQSKGKNSSRNNGSYTYNRSLLPRVKMI